MSKHDRLFDAKVRKRILEEVGLGRRRPDDIAGPQAVAESGTIEHDHAIILGGEIDQTTRFEILDHAAIAMEQNQRPAGSPLDIVQADTVDVDEPTLWGVIALCLVGKAPIDKRGGRHHAGCRDERGGEGIFRESTKGRGRERGRAFL